nr:PREDICTED: uncharacterized protein LOC103353677 [Stegastes partitus]
MDQRKPRRELSQEIRKKIIDKQVKSKDYKTTSKQLDVPVTTVAHIIQIPMSTVYVRFSSICWRTNSEEAFQQLKALFTTAPILMVPDPSQQFVVETPPIMGWEPSSPSALKRTRSFNPAPSCLGSSHQLRGTLMLGTDIVSDRGFISRFWKEFCKLIGVTVSLTSGYHPESNGQTERLNQEFETCFRCLMLQNPASASWSKNLVWVEHAHNSLITSATGMSPFQLRQITNYKPQALKAADDLRLANSLNEHYCRFERQWDSPENIPHHTSDQPQSITCTSTITAGASPQLPTSEAPSSSSFSPISPLPTVTPFSIQEKDVNKLFKRQNPCKPDLHDYPVPKKQRTSELNDLRHLALTSVATMSFERLMLGHINDTTDPHLDPLQFA